MQWMVLPFRRYAEFTGRSRRMEYWMFVLFNVIVTTVLMCIVLGVSGVSAILQGAEANAGFGIFGMLLQSGIGILVLLYWLAVVVPSIAVTIRRLHDRNLSGWWYLGAVVLGFVPFVGLLVSIAFVVVLALPGDEGSNRFGPDPKGVDEAEVFA